MVFFAGIIILLHNVLPHEHHGQKSIDDDICCDTNKNLVDYLELIFHTDMGDGHLENFESGQSLDFEFSSAIAVLPIMGIMNYHIYMISGEHSFIASEFYLKDDPFPDTPTHRLFSLRGPPSFS